METEVFTRFQREGAGSKPHGARKNHYSVLPCALCLARGPCCNSLAILNLIEDACETSEQQGFPLMFAGNRPIMQRHRP